MKKLILLFGLILLYSNTIYSATINVPGDYPTIQAAINAATDGDIIQIAAGTFTETLSVSKSLTFIGSGPASLPTTIITSTANPMISLTVTGKSFTFQNLIIEGNVTNNGIRANGSININSLIMQDVIGRNCQVALYLAEYWPGADPLTTTVSNLFMDNVTLTNNKFIGAYIGKTVLSGTVTNCTVTDNGYSDELPASWQKTGLQFVNFDEASVPHIVVTNSTFSNNGAGASNIERTGLIIYTAYNALSANEIMTVSGCSFTNHPQYAVRIKNGYNVGNTATVNGTFTNNYLDIWFNNVIGSTSSTTLVRNTVSGIKTVGLGPTYDYNTIQAAVDASSSGDIINVYPGTYNQDEANDRDPVNGGPGTSDFNIFVDKSVTIQGVTAGGVPIINNSGVLAYVIPKRNTPLGNLSTFFIQANNVTISGLDVTAFDDPNYNFKTISVIGENVTIKNCALRARDQVSSIYMYDPRYNSGTNTSYLQSYRFEGNSMDAGGIYASGIRISSGPGWTGNSANRIITNNTITAGSYGIEFVGPGGDSWDVYPVGAATITNNSFSGLDKGSVVAWGEYQSAVGYGNIDWNGILSNNTFDKAVIVKTTGGDIRDYDFYYEDPPGTPHNFKYIRGIYSAIQRYPINRVAQSSDVINVAAGTYIEPAQLDINKNLTLLGVSAATTIVKPGFNTTVGGNVKSESFIYIDPLATVVMKNFTIDCAGQQVNHAIQSRGALDIEDCVLQNVKWGTYNGRGIVFFGGTTNNLVKNVSMTNMERIGVHVRGNVMSPNPVVSIQNFTFTGKGPGDWLDYGIEFGGGGAGSVDNANISNCKGIASVDGSTSAGILVTDYWGTGTNATITNSTLSNNTTGIAVGYGPADNSVVVAHNNNIVGNTSYGVTSTNPPVNAENNWWGTAVESEIQAMISGPVDYDPWIGKAQTVPVSQTSPTIYDFPSAGVKMIFNTLPNGGGNVTVQRYNVAPTPFPSGYTNVGLWLDITSTMPNYSFNVTVYVDVFGIVGFDATTTVMYKTSGGTWMAIPGGTYLASDPMFGGHPSFSFVTNHFTPFTFINTPADAYDVYLSTSNTVIGGTIYPNTDWGVTGYEGTLGNDWDFTTPVSLYIVPEATSQFGATTITIQWDNTVYDFVGVDKTGGIYDNTLYSFNVLPSANQVIIDASRQDNANFTIGAGQYIAKINFDLIKPGFNPISFSALDFRVYDGIGGFSGLFVTGNNAHVKSYLGDVASSTTTLTGDGIINNFDLNAWSISYWSGVPGYQHGMTYYKVKYDVGPTSDNTVYGTPAVNGQIQFEDLVIFSMSYGLSANHVYPKIEAEPTEPVELQLGEPIIAGSQTRIPLFVSGGVQNVRAMSLTFAGQFGKLVSVEKGTLLTDFTNPVMLLSNVDGSQVFVDFAVLGAEESGIDAEGEVLTLVFEGNAELNISRAEVRNIFNSSMVVNISGTSELVPSEFALLQNYPNPFNPTTTINYELPEQTMVEISIFNALGERVAMLVNEIKDAGRHTVEFNASGYSSGIYFYQIKANDFVSVKKMILMK